jgi:hypothetical protein
MVTHVPNATFDAKLANWITWHYIIGGKYVFDTTYAAKNNKIMVIKILKKKKKKKKSRKLRVTGHPNFS